MIFRIICFTADILNIDPGSELAQQMQKRMDEGQKITADQIRSLVQEYGNALAKASPEALEAHTAYIEQQEAKAAKQDFAPDLSKYSGRQLESVKRAVESGVLNNTRMTHTMVDLISKLEADKGVAFRWMDNEKLKESGFALEGKIVNGVKTADSILLNVDSHKALNAVAGHEITHVLEGTEFYDSFRQLAVQLAKAKGEYDSRMADLKQLYKEGTDLEAELVADIVGDYIFTDELFIRSLQTGKPGLFRAVYDEIKYLRRMATAGSKEAKALIKAEKLFEKIYRQPVETTTETKYSAARNKDFSREFDYSQLNWAYDLGIITKKDGAIFERTINNEIARGAKPHSANGEYIIDTGKCLMFTDGDFHSPTLSRVIVFETEYETLIDDAKRRIINEAGSTGDVQESLYAIEDLYGYGFAVEHTQTIYSTDARQNRGGKGSNRGGGGKKTGTKSLKERFAEEGLSHLLEDDKVSQISIPYLPCRRHRWEMRMLMHRLR